MSHAYSYLRTNIRDYLYDGKYAPFENNLDAPLDIKEAEEVFTTFPPWDVEILTDGRMPPPKAKNVKVSNSFDVEFKRPEELFGTFPTWDVELLTEKWAPPVVAETRESVSFDVGAVKKIFFNEERLPFLLYGRDTLYNQTGTRIFGMDDTVGFLFNGEKSVKLLKPFSSIGNENIDAAINNDIITFQKKEANKKISLRIIPIGAKTKEYYPDKYSYPPLYYAASAGVIRLCDSFSSGIINKFFFVRLMSVIVGFVALYFVYNAFMIIWHNNEEYALCGMILFGFWPMNSFIFGVANPDAFLNFFACAAFYYIIRILFTERDRNTDWILFSVMSSLAALSKVSGILLVMIWWSGLALALLLKKRKMRPIWLLPPLLMFAAPYLMWFRKHGFGVLYGEGKNLSLLGYLKELVTLVRWLSKSFFGNFGIQRAPMPQLLYFILALFIMIMIAIFIYGLVKGFGKGRKMPFLYLALATAFSLAFFFVMEYISLNKRGFVLQGRYFLFLALPMLVIIWSAAVEQENESIKRFGKGIAYFFAASMIIINAVALMNYAIRNFAVDYVSALGFFDRATQFKPSFIKGAPFYLIVILYFFGIVFLLMRLLRIMYSGIK